MYFDMHVHCRDGPEKGKDTIKHVLDTCERAGVDGILDMPNTKPAITTRGLAEDRIALADSSDSPVFYGIHMGLTKDSDQIRNAVETYNALFPRIAGLKLFAGSSTGDLAITEIADQERVYRILRDCGYKGVLTVHCEKESMMRPELFNYRSPRTHSLARPPLAEFESVEDQVRLALQNEFDGKLHIAHVSHLLTAKLLTDYQRNLSDSDQHSLRLSFGVTPHHLFLDDSAMNGEWGNYYKVNPPLRTRDDRGGLMLMLRRGKIGVIETDHAPHMLLEKLGSNPPSGIPGIDKWPKIARKLEEMGFGKNHIDDLTFNNAVRLFGLEKFVKRSDNKGDLNLREYPYGDYL